MVNTIIQKQLNPGIYLVTITRQKVKELYITIHPNTGEKLSSMIDRLTYSLQEQNARIVKFDVLGSLDEFSVCMKFLENVYGHVEWPVTWVEGNCRSGEGVVGIQVYAVSGVPVETIFLDNKPIARVFEDNFAKYCILGNVLSSTSSASREEQTRHTLENIEKTLRLTGMDMSNVVRTWFHNDNILCWYEKFNAVRNSFFKERDVFNKLLSASTGIGGKNPAHTAVIASAVAIQAKKDSVTIQRVLSPLQCPATDYGSSFNRAVEIIMPDHRRILVSGTASIETSGKTVHIDDVDAQIAYTMEVVEKILVSCGMSYSDIIRAIVYLKHAKDIPAFNKYCESHKNSVMPVLIACSDICRDNLLFEIEVDAISKTKL